MFNTLVKYLFNTCEGSMYLCTKSPKLWKMQLEKGKRGPGLALVTVDVHFYKPATWVYDTHTNMSHCFFVLLILTQRYFPIDFREGRKKKGSEGREGEGGEGDGEGEREMID